MFTSKERVLRGGAIAITSLAAFSFPAREASAADLIPDRASSAHVDRPLAFSSQFHPLSPFNPLNPLSPLHPGHHSSSPQETPRALTPEDEKNAGALGWVMGGMTGAFTAAALGAMWYERRRRD